MIIGPGCLMNAFYLFPELLFSGMEPMGCSGHFVKCTNRAACDDSGHPEKARSQRCRWTLIRSSVWKGGGHLVVGEGISLLCM